MQLDCESIAVVVGHLNSESIKKLMLVNRKYHSAFNSVKVNTGKFKLKKELEIFPNIETIKSDVNEIEELIDSDETALNKITSYEIVYSACYLNSVKFDTLIKSKITKIITTTNCLSAFNGLLSMKKINSVKLNIYFDEDYDSDDSEDSQLLSYQRLFNAIDKLNITKVFVFCKSYDFMKLCDLIVGLKATYIFTLDSSIAVPMNTPDPDFDLPTNCTLCCYKVNVASDFAHYMWRENESGYMTVISHAFFSHEFEKVKKDYMPYRICIDADNEPITYDGRESGIQDILVVNRTKQTDIVNIPRVTFK